MKCSFLFNCRKKYYFCSIKNTSTLNPYTRVTLDNGLTVLLLPDNSTKMACVSILYKVGSRDEQSHKTGIAHLFEHLMFSNCGIDVNFDEIMQNAGGESNAFTTPDTTQYYNIAPVQQLELMLQLEALRMQGFNIGKKEFKIQQKVVIEEFSEHYLNNPYGMFSHWIFDLSYQKHPYKWPVIGQNQEDISNLVYDDAVAFYDHYYHPTNAILVISGNINIDQTIKLVNLHFGTIGSKSIVQKKYPSEDLQTEKRERTILGTYPEEALYISFHCSNRKNPDFYALDFLTDILSEGKSSILYSSLKKEKMLFSSIDCYLTATTDPGLIIMEGKLNTGINIQQGQDAFWEVINKLKNQEISDHDWQKYMNKNESAYLFSQLGTVNQALNLSYAEWLEDPDLIYTELDHYTQLTREDIHRVLNQYINPQQGNYLYLSNH